MIKFILGLMLGGGIGVFTVALVQANKNEPNFH